MGRIVSADVDERLYQAIQLLARGVGAKWWTSAVQMVTGGQATRYVLLHLSNSPHGRDLMKECAWKSFPSGQFRVRKSDNPDQQVLFEPQPDLKPLRAWVIAQLQTGPKRWQALHEAIRSELWLEKHVNQTVRSLKNDGLIDSDPIPQGRKFGAAANPRLWLKGTR